MIRPTLPFTSALIPVLTVSDVSHAAPLALALQAGGLDVAEITFRTPQAADAIKLMKDAAPQMQIGAGTILNARDMTRAIDAGADFLITPTTSPKLRDILKACDRPIYPGAATPREAQDLYDHGYEIVKLFPAEAVGGRRLLTSIAAPLPHLTFIPTGGINAVLAPDYLKLNNVAAIGGSWMVDNDALNNKDWARITADVKAAFAAL